MPWGANMKISVNELMNVDLALSGLATVQLPITVSFKLSVLMKRIRPHIKSANEQRTELAKQLGVEDENIQGQYKIKNENKQKFQDELDKLAKIEVVIDFSRIRISDIGDIKIQPSLLHQNIFKE